MKMEPLVSSETSVIRTQTPGNYPKRNKLNLEHGESLKTRRIYYSCAIYVHLTFMWNTKLINLLNPTGYVMHQQFKIQQLYALPTLHLCVLYLSENRQRLVPLTA